MGEAMGEEAAAQEVAVLLGPGLNIKRSPLCGRNFEYFSEDPYLAGKMAAAYMCGASRKTASPPAPSTLPSTVRSCAAWRRFRCGRAHPAGAVPDRLRDRGQGGAPKTIMSSYNLINGTYANENAHLLQDILRRDWGFDGAVVTDWGGSNDHALGVKNGSTLEMPAPGGDAMRELMKAVQSGKITERMWTPGWTSCWTLVFDTQARRGKAQPHL